MSKHIEQNSDEARSSFITHITRDHFLQEKKSSAVTPVQTELVSSYKYTPQVANNDSKHTRAISSPSIIMGGKIQ